MEELVLLKKRLEWVIILRYVLFCEGTGPSDGASVKVSLGNARDRPCGSVGFVEKAA